jgi:hypothetical protein
LSADEDGVGHVRITRMREETENVSRTGRATRDVGATLATVPNVARGKCKPPRRSAG